MPLTGILRTWHDDRGFGFIAPTHGGAEVFVHISAFPRDGSRPTQGEQLRYQLGRGRKGDMQAVNVTRLAVGTPPPRQPHGTQPAMGARPSRRPVSPPARRSRLPLLLGVLLLGIAAVLVHGKLIAPKPDMTPQQVATPPAAAPEVETPAGNFRCDGRRHCSQMTSCTEAKYFLKNCPGVEMDGNHDGVPCEQQWCTSPWSK